MNAIVPVTSLTTQIIALIKRELAPIFQIDAPTYPTTRTPFRGRGVDLREVVLYLGARDPAGRVLVRTLEDGGAPFPIFRVKPMGSVLRVHGVVAVSAGGGLAVPLRNGRTAEEVMAVAVGADYWEERGGGSRSRFNGKVKS